MKLNEIVIDTGYLEFINISGCKLNVAHLNDLLISGLDRAITGNYRQNQMIKSKSF
ncbi:hypothetical protein [Nitrosomonas supralitoralis]|uniref:hypothetical protein n=1 Tax=Nitrosomonas supralitoralis TaxID=2116706 RepID=UPI0015585B11|nr:hypothetical protein [Nitrosomonas supralitoralis]